MKYIQTFENINEAKQTETQRMDGKDAVFMGAGKYNNKIGQISIESDDSITLVMPRGKYIVNVDKNDLRLVESINEAKFNFTEAEIKTAAETLAKAMAKSDKVKVEVHDFEYDKDKGAGFELSYDGENKM